MKILGLLGGMSWESSIEYEKHINRLVRERIGGVASADLIIRSFNFADIEMLQAAGTWDAAADLLAEAAVQLESAGAEAIVLCTNTMHKVADRIQQAITIPLLHIADATGAEIVKHRLRRVLLLGTKLTMEEDFYSSRLEASFGLEVVIPKLGQRNEIHRVIYEELVQGKVVDASREYFKSVIAEFELSGVEAIIAGCTEIELLLSPSDISLPLFATTAIHARAAVDFSLAG